jgi:hypothetical protein
MEPQKGDCVSRCRGPRLQLMVERQTIGANRISKMERGISVGQQVDQFTIVCCRNDNMGIWSASIRHQLLKHCLPGGDALHCVRAAKQFV